MHSVKHENLLDVEFSSPGEIAHGEKYISFFLNEELYAIAADQVKEVVASLAATPLPKTPEWILGIANLRGMIISVIDLAKFWQKGASSPTLKSKLILLRSKSGDARIAFVIDKLSEIIVLPKTQIQSAEMEEASSLPGKITYKSSVINLLDAEKLVRSSKFRVQS